jgi:hypothetical protein
VASDHIDRTYQVIGAIDELTANLLDAETAFRLSADRKSAVSRSLQRRGTPDHDNAASLTALVKDDPRQMESRHDD